MVRSVCCGYQNCMSFENKPEFAYQLQTHALCAMHNANYVNTPLFILLTECHVEEYTI